MPANVIILYAGAIAGSGQRSVVKAWPRKLFFPQKGVFVFSYSFLYFTDRWGVRQIEKPREYFAIRSRASRTDSSRGGPHVMNLVAGGPSRDEFGRGSPPRDEFGRGSPPRDKSGRGGSPA